jgi:plasmid stability protein
MANLLLRDVPTDVFERLKARAKRERRSMPAETIHLLTEVLAQDAMREEHQRAMHSIIERSRTKIALPVEGQELLRQARER